MGLIKDLDGIYTIDVLSDYDYYLKQELGLEATLADNYLHSSNKITIINKSKYISEEQVTAILGLLHKDYQTINITIHIYGRKINLYKDFYKFLEIGKIKKGTCGIQSGNDIYLFCYNLKRWLKRINTEGANIADYMKLTLISVLLHELRHVYQMKYMTKKIYRS